MHLGQFVALQHSVQNGPNLCKSSCHEVASEFFAMNAPVPPHWTQYSCVVAFRCVWVHLGLFCRFMILGSKQAELLQLMQKFVPQSRVRIFCNKSTLSTPSDPKLMFWCVSYCLVHLGQFRYCMKLGAKRAELVQLMQKLVPRSRVGIFTTNTPNPPHWTLNSSFVAFLSVWVHLGLFLLRQ